MTTLKRCGACGSRNIIQRNVKGRYFSFKSFPRLKLETDVFMNVCNQCENIIMVKGNSELLEEGLKTSAILQSSSYIEKVLERMHWRQNEMAEYIGCSPVYLSELKNGKRVPERVR